MGKKKSTEEELEQQKSPGLSLLFGEITTELVADTIAWILKFSYH